MRLEWHINHDVAQKIGSIHFTCEAWDYFDFLGKHAPATVLALYPTFVNPPVSDAVLQADLFPGGGATTG